MTIWRSCLAFALTLAGILPAAQAAAEPQSAVGAAAPSAKDRHPVLLISIDGLRPDAVLEADKHGLNIPVLRRFLSEGSYARSVINVNPTVTNPNHTTLITGVLPIEHGIYNNRPFAPTAKLPKSYSLYAQIKAPTLWRAAKDSGLTTGSLFWPVTGQATDIDHNIIEGDDEDDRKITDDAIALIKRKRPDLLTVHFVRFDHKQHEFGPFSAEGNAALERIDTEIGRVIDAQRRAQPRSVIAIVSDHGFDRAAHQVNLNAAFADAGFIEHRGKGDDLEVTSWQAFAWYVGGSAMIVFQDRYDPKIRHQVETCLEKLASDPGNGIERIYRRSTYTNRGLPPAAEYVVAFRPGYRMGNAMSGPLIQPSSGGAHGAFSTKDVRPDMHSSFFITGPDVAAGRNLGIIDMRQIAPTLASELKVSLPSAKAPPLPIHTP